MYQIKCDGFVLYDPRDEDLIVINPRCNLGANTVGEASFTLLSDHMYFDKLKRLKSIFEIKQNDHTIFRGRMTNDSKDFYNRLDVDLEGVLGFANDTIIEPFASEQEPLVLSVDMFLEFVLTKHNAQVKPWQKLKLGNVKGFSESIRRYSEKYTTTWEILKTRLIESELGGYLVVRYEDDGNYVDYVKNLDETAPQQITFGQNMLDITRATDASETYSAILPLGGETQVGAGSDYEGDYGVITNTTKSRISLSNLPDGDLTDDLAKKGLFVYSKSAVEQYGWICAPVENTTWDDITTENGLKNKAIEYLSKTAMLWSDTIEINAVDLSFTDDQIQSFRINQNVLVNSPVHGISNVIYPLTKLEIDIMNPQNTKITLGETKRVLTDKANRASKQIDDVKIKANIELNDKVGRTENDHVVNMINRSTATLELTGKRLVVESDNFILDENGELTITGAIFATEGIIGDCEIADGKLIVNSVRSTGSFGTTSVWDGYIVFDKSNGSVGASIRYDQSNERLYISGNDSGIQMSKTYFNDNGNFIVAIGEEYDFGGGVYVRFADGGGETKGWIGNRIIGNSQYLAIETDFDGQNFAGMMLNASNERNNIIYGSWEFPDGEPSYGSDRNIKTDITDIPDEYGTYFDNLRVKVFKYKDGNSGRKHIGLIAQDAYDALEPANLSSMDFAGVCVRDKGTDDELWTIRMGEYTALCIHEIQKLKQEIKELRGNIA